MVGILHEFGRRKFDQSFLYFKRRFAFGQPDAVAQSEYMRVDSYRRLAECRIQNDVRRFSLQRLKL